MKTFKSLAETPHILITSEDIDTIFCNIPELYNIHCEFICQLEPRVRCWTSGTQIAELFKLLALEEYPLATKYLKNYHEAVATIRRCSQQNSQFREVTQEISCKGLTEKPSLEAVKRKKYNVSFLKDAQTREEYRLNLTNRFQVLQELLEEETDLNKQWQNIKETWTSTCQEVVGPRTPQQKEWISVETLRKVQMRKEKKTAVNNSRTRTAKAKVQEEYAEVNREVKKSIKVDKRNYIDSLAE
ncbi:Breakpoint cluster region protein [Lamellibrachia satsuma]|nr:Breakpoint cluster region protein [Lamellibrachia satsuma]